MPHDESVDRDDEYQYGQGETLALAERKAAMVPPPPPADALPRAAFEAVAARERVSDRYWSRNDPLNAQRMLWRSQTVRQMFHVLPGETILELGCGSGHLTRALLATTRGECPVTAASFLPDVEQSPPGPRAAGAQAELVRLEGFPGALSGRRFDYVVATNLLDLNSAPAVLREVMALLKPGGRLLFFETNPWNPMFGLRRRVSRWLPFLRRGDERALLNQTQLYELLSELGFISIGATCYDFLYPPIPSFLLRPARNLSLILENTPGVRRFAGSILLHAQRPPRPVTRPEVKLTDHESLRDAVSVVVPCHNEEMNVGPLVDGLFRHYGDYVHEIVLVDDNSKDRTRQVLETLAACEPRVRPVFRSPPNGVGRAISDGLNHARGRYVLMMDCDFLHILPELRDLFDAAADGADVVLGSRFSRSSVLINYPLQKILCNRSFHVLLSLLFRRRVRDLTNNLKLMKREVIEDLDLESAWFAANAETGLKPLLMGYDVRPVPISWINRTPEMGQSSFSLLKNGIGYARVLGSLAWRTRFGLRPLPRKSRGAVGS
ncbi:MAG: glycosyltransferase [Isosphaeraceae bacterium]